MAKIWEEWALTLHKYSLCLWEAEADLEDSVVQIQEANLQIKTQEIKINLRALEDLTDLVSKILEVSTLLEETSVRKQNNKNEFFLIISDIFSIFNF